MYTARISVKNPQAVVFLVDQSGSMSEHMMWRGMSVPKSEATAEVLNGVLSELVMRCNQYGHYRHYFDIAVFGYSGSGVRSLLGNDSRFVSPSHLAHMITRVVDITNVRRMSDGRDVVTYMRQKIWVEAHSEGETPMGAAFEKAYETLAPWVYPRQREEAFPPMVINVTDGEMNDTLPENLVKTAEKIKRLSTADGNALLINVHISNNSEQTHVFPSSHKCPVADCAHAHRLFDISSIMPDVFNQEIAHISCCAPPHRAFSYNTSIADLMRLLNISSSTLNLSL